MASFHSRKQAGCLMTAGSTEARRTVCLPAAGLPPGMAPQLGGGVREPAAGPSPAAVHQPGACTTVQWARVSVGESSRAGTRSPSRGTRTRGVALGLQQSHLMSTMPGKAGTRAGGDGWRSLLEFKGAHCSALQTSPLQPATKSNRALSIGDSRLHAAAFREFSSQSHASIHNWLTCRSGPGSLSSTFPNTSMAPLTVQV